jgi:hypothetical protein
MCACSYLGISLVVSDNLEVDGTIDIEKIDSVLQVGRPVHGAQNTGIPYSRS